MSTYVAIAVLLPLPLLGIVAIRRRLDKVFCPGSPLLWEILWLVLLVQGVVSVGVLAFGSWWHNLIPWSALLFFLYVAARGLYLLLSSPEEPTGNNRG